MTGWNTSYAIRTDIGFDEIRRAFGTLDEALRITGGNMSVIQLYMHNTQRIVGAPSVEPAQTDFAKRLRERAECDRAAACFSLAKTITGVAKEMGVCRSKAKRLLLLAGVWPAPKQ